MNALELTTSVTAIGNLIACNLSDDELALAAAVLTQLGDTLATISALRGIDCNNKNNDNKNCDNTSN